MATTRRVPRCGYPLGGLLVAESDWTIGPFPTRRVSSMGESNGIAEQSILVVMAGVIGSHLPYNKLHTAI